VIDAGVTEWVLHPRKFDHAECGEVYISANPISLSAKKFISSTPNIGAKKSKSNRLFFVYKKIEPKSNREENHNRHITSISKHADPTSTHRRIS